MEEKNTNETKAEVESAPRRELLKQLAKTAYIAPATLALLSTRSNAASLL